MPYYLKKLVFLLVSEGSRENACGRCAHIDKLLSLVAQLCEEVDRLSIQASEGLPAGTTLCPHWNRNVS